ncbi:uncharacterized protein E5676_scaffold701G00680 [Cucumis melo var. makuwa]|uniref:Uncharacterized protein n=1 Tax=Cucumis melo var. makuwa TaxID=1194695 RepID=A0A5D3BLD4_CUCMM|nr:uncharacterized protein E5676_scaffold701G00680 [Cucumis melo var. makuwa]
MSVALRVSGTWRQVPSLLWTINDFSAYSDLLGWSTKGYQAYPICMGERSSSGIRGRISFMGHRRYLLENHMRRRSRLHDGKEEKRLFHWYILNNFDEISEYRKHEWPFPEWFQAKVLELHESENLSYDYFSLMMGPSFDVRCYNGCIMGELKFHSQNLILDALHKTVD